jgi:hypothetical protein
MLYLRASPSTLWLVLFSTFVLVQWHDCTGLNAINLQCRTAEVLYTRDFFYVGGRPIETATGELIADKLDVEKIVPAPGSQKSTPLVFFHGGGCAATFWLNTPDNERALRPTSSSKDTQSTLLTPHPSGAAHPQTLPPSL